MQNLSLILAIAVSFANGQFFFRGSPECDAPGFYRNPDDCTKFYRCVDQTGTGIYRAFHFDCPAGTVFDENVSVCNWPYLAPPCGESGQNQEAGSEQDTDSNTDNGSSDVVVVSPVFSFECTAPGFFAHDSDCARFWLCKQEGGGYLGPELYKCPKDYLFNDAIRRCVKEDEVDCDKVPDLARIAFEPEPIQLRVQDLQSFFARYRF